MSTSENPFKKLINQNGIIMLGGLGFSFIAAWLTTKVMNQEEVGIYQIMINTIETVALITTAGFQLLAVKEIPGLVQKGQRINRFLKQGHRMVFLSLTILLPLVYIIMYQLGDSALYKQALLFIMIGIPAYTLLKFYGSILQGLKKFTLAHLPERLLRPILVAVICLIFWGSYSESILFALLAGILCLAFIFGVVFYSITKRRAKELKENGPKINFYKASLLLMPFFIFSNLIMRVDGYMLWYFEPPETFAVYAQSMKIASICTIGLILFEYIFTPFISENNTAIQVNELSIRMVKQLRPILLGTLILFTLLVFIGGPLLGYFGKSGEVYNTGFTALIILSIGHILGLCLGPVSNILIVNNLSKKALQYVLLAFIMNITLNAILIPLHGMNGAAIATAIALIIYKVLAYISVRNNLGYKCAIFEKV
jgi:O-antigen/teichoic acid export membrane protein